MTADTDDAVSKYSLGFVDQTHDTDDASSKYSVGFVDQTHYILVVGLVYQECLLVMTQKFCWLPMASVTSGSHENRALHNQMLDGDITVCHFP